MNHREQAEKAHYYLSMQAPHPAIAHALLALYELLAERLPVIPGANMTYTGDEE